MKFDKWFLLPASIWQKNKKWKLNKEYSVWNEKGLRWEERARKRIENKVRKKRTSEKVFSLKISLATGFICLTFDDNKKKYIGNVVQPFCFYITAH